jgi:hypothetical protein
MWNVMMAGATPFTTQTSPTQRLTINDQDNRNMCATLKLQPILPKWLFQNSSGTSQLTFTFLGSVPVTYFNPEYVCISDISTMQSLFFV